MGECGIVSKDDLPYDRMVEDALRGVVRQALAQVAAQGLPGNHHFYISFRTDHPDVAIAERLRRQFPGEMTIVLQHEFWDLEVGPDSFAVSLSFSGIRERLAISFAAVTAFTDPEVRFGLQFRLGQSTDRSAEGSAEGSGKAPEPDPEAGSEKVVALERFRKK